MKSLIMLYVFGITSLSFAQTSQLRYEGQLEGGALAGATLTNQNFEVSLRRPDNCGGTLGVTKWTTSTVEIKDGVFILTPTFDSSDLANAMDPSNQFGESCSSDPTRELVIKWYDGSGWETFYVPISDAPRATYALKSQNTEAIGNVKVNPAMSCSTGQYLRFNSVGGEFTCSSIPATDVPSLNASVISSGTLSPGVVPNLVGDVTGTISSTTVEKIRGVDVSTVAPTQARC